MIRASQLYVSLLSLETDRYDMFRTLWGVWRTSKLQEFSNVLVVQYTIWTRIYLFVVALRGQNDSRESTLSAVSLVSPEPTGTTTLELSEDV